MAELNANNSSSELTSWEEAEADKDGQDITHAQDIVQKVRCSEEQRCRNPKGCEVSKVI